MHQSFRDVILEQVALMLASSYPDNVSTNAFCAAIRSMKAPPQQGREPNDRREAPDA
jgi:hypothetical protein